MKYCRSCQLAYQLPEGRGTELSDCEVCSFKNEACTNIDFGLLVSILQGKVYQEPAFDHVKLKPFSLKRALAGDPVMTGNGQGVVQIAHFPYCNELERLVVQLLGDTVCRSYGEDGIWSQKGICSNSENLFMAPKTREVWVNLYDSKWINETGIPSSFCTHYPTEDIADKSMLALVPRLGHRAHKIIVEE